MWAWPHGSSDIGGRGHTGASRLGRGHTAASCRGRGHMGAASHLQDVVQSQVTEAPAGDAEGAGGVLDLVRPVPRRLSVPHLRDLQVFAHLVEGLLGLLELPNIPEREKRGQKRDGDEASGTS